MKKLLATMARESFILVKHIIKKVELFLQTQVWKDVCNDVIRSLKDETMEVLTKERIGGDKEWRTEEIEYLVRRSKGK